MEAGRSSRFSAHTALAALLLVLALPAAVPCTPSDSSNHSISADSTPAEKNRAERERCKKSENGRIPKGCPDGGERLPQDKRSPLDTIPPLSPLVA
jgi:hypothetical protein